MFTPVIMSKRTRIRKQRRQAKMTLRSRGKFRVNHRSRSGRTGSVRATQLKGRPR